MEREMKQKKNYTNHKYWATSDPTTERLCAVWYGYGYRYRYATRTHINCTIHNQQGFIALLLLEPLLSSKCIRKSSITIMPITNDLVVVHEEIGCRWAKMICVRTFQFYDSGISLYATTIHSIIILTNINLFVRCCCLYFMFILYLCLSVLFSFAFDNIPLVLMTGSCVIKIQTEWKSAA